MPSLVLCITHPGLTCTAQPCYEPGSRTDATPAVCTHQQCAHGAALPRARPERHLERRCAALLCQLKSQMSTCGACMA